MKEPLNLSKISKSQLEFWAKWDIEEKYDGVTIEIKVNDGEWKSLRGKFTQKATGSGNGQPKGMFVYQGKQTKWVRESISLLISVVKKRFLFLVFLTISESPGSNTGSLFKSLLFQSFIFSSLTSTTLTSILGHLCAITAIVGPPT